MSRVPIIVILGATGSGKSRLGIELARRFRGEIISADSMQVYKCLNIVTAKVTKTEQAQAQHHMIDILDPIQELTVIDFRNKALKIIDNLLKENKLPLIVGGTNYYIESLIWQILVDDPKQPGDELDSHEELQASKKPRCEAVSNEDLHKKLMQVDPEMAERLHPNDRRKVIRSLEIFERHGQTHSEILKQQRLAGGCGLGGPLRHNNSIIFWLTCSRTVLNERLDARVDSMLKAGLVQELLDFHERYNKDRLEENKLPDYTHGIFQSIGFKEFHNYLILPKEERETEKARKMLSEAIEHLKIATRRYAKRQRKWVNNRLLRRADRQVPPVYSLDCSDVEQWESEVYGKAVEIVSAVMRGATPTQQPMNSVIDNAKDTDSSNFKRHFCEVCQRIIISDLQWDAHMTGARHRKMILKRKRQSQSQTQEQPANESNVCQEEKKR